MKNSSKQPPFFKTYILLLCVVLCNGIAAGQDFHVDKIHLEAGSVVISVVEEDLSGPQSNYYILRSSMSPEFLFTPVKMVLGQGGRAEIAVGRGDAQRNYYRVDRVPTNRLLDGDADLIDDVWELERPNLLDPLAAGDAGLDPDGDGLTHLADYVLERGYLTLLTDATPRLGETGVPLTRETILNFSYPLAQGGPDVDSVFATFAGKRLAARNHLSADRRTLTLFYEDGLPPNARVSVVVAGDSLLDLAGRPVDADANGTTGGTIAVEFDTLTRTVLRNAAVHGRVFSSRLNPNPDNDPDTDDAYLNTPLEGATVTVRQASQFPRMRTANSASTTLQSVASTPWSRVAQGMLRLAMFGSRLRRRIPSSMTSSFR